MHQQSYNLIFKSAFGVQTLKLSLRVTDMNKLVLSEKEQRKEKKGSSFPVCRLLIQWKHAALSPQRHISFVWMWLQEGWAQSAYANRQPITLKTLQTKVGHQGETCHFWMEKAYRQQRVKQWQRVRDTMRISFDGLDYKLDYILTEWCHCNGWEGHWDYTLTPLLYIVFIHHNK